MNDSLKKSIESFGTKITCWASLVDWLSRRRGSSQGWNIQLDHGCFSKWYCSSTEMCNAISSRVKDSYRNQSEN